MQALEGTAKAQASRIRLRALREAAEVSGAARRLATERATNELLAAIERAVERLAAADREEPAPEAEAGQRPAAGEGAPAGAGLPADGGPAAGRRVSVDVGPFSDFSQLVSFEDAANAIEGAGEISIRRFSGGRASIDVDLEGPVDLLRELEQRCDLDFEVRANGSGEIVLDVDP